MKFDISIPTEVQKTVEFSASHQKYMFLMVSYYITLLEYRLLFDLVVKTNTLEVETLAGRNFRDFTNFLTFARVYTRQIFILLLRSLTK